MIARTTKVFKQFFESEKSGGITLIFCTFISLLIANSSLQVDYLHLFEYELGGMSIEHWVNDGLMAIFFLLIGLELKREFQVGELSSIKKASLPIFSAIGGMLVPALIYAYFNFGQTTDTGFGIPMATDIAFALGALSLLGDKIPTSLKVFLTALAVIDDLGAILVIAIFYTKTILIDNLVISLVLFVFLLLMNRFKVRSLWVYLPIGVVMWYFMHHSGIHATITGVLLAFTIPTSYDKKGFSPSEFLQSTLHYPVPYIILPLFALVNTAVVIGPDWDLAFMQNASLGILFGLVVGKPLGIFLFSYIAIKLKLGEKPDQTNWGQLFGVGILGGIGFTMSIFVTLLAFNDTVLINNSKFAIIVSSVCAGMFGMIALKIASPRSKQKKVKKT
jgi:NhaA family Na+:H+ antiporter